MIYNVNDYIIVQVTHTIKQSEKQGKYGDAGENGIWLLLVVIKLVAKFIDQI